MKNSKNRKIGNFKNGEIRVENNTGMKGFTFIQNRENAKSEKSQKCRNVIFDFLKIIVFLTLPVLTICIFSKKRKG